jgi:transposase
MTTKKPDEVQTMEAHLGGASTTLIIKQTKRITEHDPPLWTPSPGRPRKISAEAEERMRELFTAEAQRYEEKQGRRLTGKSKWTKTLLEFAAKEAGVQVSLDTLRRRIAVPVLRKLREGK